MKTIEFPISIPQEQYDELSAIVRRVGSPSGKILTILNNFVNENGICPPAAEEIIPELRKLQNSMVAAKVDHLILFGSVARGQADKGSDIDLMADFRGETGVSDLEYIKNLVEGSLGRKYKFDVVPKSWLKSEILESALSEGIKIF